MKLSEYIYNKLIEGKVVGGPNKYSNFGVEPTEEDINQWIIEWYKSEFKEVGCDGEIPKARMPPSWRANWRNK